MGHLKSLILKSILKARYRSDVNKPFSTNGKYANSGASTLYFRAVSYVDQNVLHKSNNLGLSYAEDGEVGISGDLMTTALGLELHMGFFNPYALSRY